MHPKEIRLLDFYGGAYIVPLDDYFRGSELSAAPTMSGPRALRIH